MGSLLLLLLLAIAASADVPPVEHYIAVQNNASVLEVAWRAGLSVLRERGGSGRGVVSERMLWSGREEQLAALRAAGVQYRIVSSSSDSNNVALLRRQTAYHNYQQLSDLVADLARRYPQWCKQFTVGQSVQGKQLLGLRFSNYSLPFDSAPRPLFKYVGNMHGDETVGREMLIQLMQDIVARAAVGDAEVRELLDNTEVWILPSMNPDGFERGTRGNIRGYDLNRNFPDRFGWQTGSVQQETDNVMKWSRENPFVLSANLHGGDLVANYPFDGNRDHRSGVYEATTEDATFRALASAYASAHAKMRASREFPGGIVNGAEWYVLYGGMQDWNYLNTNDMEITLELSHIKYPPGSTLAGFWQDNREALYAYMAVVRRWGVRGRVRGVTNGPVTIKVARYDAAMKKYVAIDHDVKSDMYYNYYRILSPGTYKVTCVPPAPLAQKEGVINIPSNQKKPIKLDFSF